MFYSTVLYSCLQVQDYAERKSKSVEKVEEWLAPVLAYDAE